MIICRYRYRLADIAWQNSGLQHSAPASPCIPQPERCKPSWAYLKSVYLLGKNKGRRFELSVLGDSPTILQSYNRTTTHRTQTSHATKHRLNSLKPIDAYQSLSNARQIDPNAQAAAGTFLHGVGGENPSQRDDAKATLMRTVHVVRGEYRSSKTILRAFENKSRSGVIIICGGLPHVLWAFFKSRSGLESVRTASRLGISRFWMFLDVFVLVQCRS
jgi:hypothetical protein